MKKIIVSIIICITLIFSLTACNKPENSKEIEYNGEIISLDTTQETIENILGEGEFLESYTPTFGDKNDIVFKYQYQDLTVYYLTTENNTTPTAKSFEWETENIKTFNNLNVGITTEKLENSLEYYNKGGEMYTAYYTLSQNIRTVSTPDKEIAYFYIFNANEEICKIQIS